MTWILEDGAGPLRLLPLLSRRLSLSYSCSGPSGTARGTCALPKFQVDAVAAGEKT